MTLQMPPQVITQNPGAILGSRADPVDYFRQILIDTVNLRDMYIFHRRHASPRDLQLLFDKHFADQHVLVDEVAGRIRKMGGTIPRVTDVAPNSLIPALPESPVGIPLISRFLQAHETILAACRALMDGASLRLRHFREVSVCNVVHTNESQVLSLFQQMSRQWNQPLCA